MIGYRNAIRVVQVILSESSPEITIDGVWGPLTSLAYDKVTGEEQTRVNSITYIVTGRTVESLRGEQTSSLAAQLLLVAEPSGEGEDVQQTNNDDRPWEVQVRNGNEPVRVIRDLIVKLAKQEGVPESTALRFFWIESRFDSTAISKTGAKGVGQLTTVAIQDVKEKTGYVLRDPFDPTDNIVCSLKYMKIVAGYLGIGLNDPVALYAGYNVGIKNAAFLLAGDHDKANPRTIKVQGFGSPENYLANVRKEMDRLSV